MTHARMWPLALVAALALCLPLNLSAQEKKDDNANTLIKKHRDNLQLSCSTFWGGWPVEKLVDGNVETSWFSNKNDTTTKNSSPWVEVKFPEDVTVSRVSILGNCEPAYPKGFAILVGKLEFFDKDGKRIHDVEDEGAGPNKDYEFKLKKPLKGVRSVRF